MAPEGQIYGYCLRWQIVVEGEPLTDGAKVTVLASDDGETFDLSSEQEAEILKAISEIEQGQGIEARRFLEDLERDT